MVQRINFLQRASLTMFDPIYIVFHTAHCGNSDEGLRWGF
jgi:hypothetical protein